jgi:hypothetical protein
VAEIKGSRELGGSQGESPGVGCSKSRVAKSRGEKDSRWIQVKGGPLDQNLIARIVHSEVRRLRGPRLDIRSREVPRAEARVWTRGRTTRWGPRDRQVDTRHLEEGVNTLLTSRVSGIREIRARELDIETCEVASSENARGEKSTSLLEGEFVKGRCQGWTHSNSRRCE